MLKARLARWLIKRIIKRVKLSKNRRGMKQTCVNCQKSFLPDDHPYAFETTDS